MFKRARGKTMGLLAVFVVGTLAFASLSTAQPGRRGFRGPGRGHDGPMRILRELDLSESQRDQIRSLMESSGGREAHERLLEARRALREGIESGQDEGTLRQLAYEVGGAEGDAAVFQMQIQAQIRQILTEEQRSELERIKEERREDAERRRERFEQRRERRRSRSQ